MIHVVPPKVTRFLRILEGPGYFDVWRERAFNACDAILLERTAEVCAMLSRQTLTVALIPNYHNLSLKNCQYLKSLYVFTPKVLKRAIATKKVI